MWLLFRPVLDEDNVLFISYYFFFFKKGRFVLAIGNAKRERNLKKNKIKFKNKILANWMNGQYSDLLIYSCIIRN